MLRLEGQRDRHTVERQPGVAFCRCIRRCRAGGARPARLGATE